MANESGKARKGPDVLTKPVFVSEATKKRPGLEKYALPGPWTEEHERFFQVLIREFGEGHGGRDPDL